MEGPCVRWHEVRAAGLRLAKQHGELGFGTEEVTFSWRLEAILIAATDSASLGDVQYLKSASGKMTVTSFMLLALVGTQGGACFCHRTRAPVYR